MFRIRVRELREKAGYRSQRAFADAFGVAQTTVAGWESGKREPSYATVSRLSAFFGVSTDYLLGRSRSESMIDLGDDNRMTATYSNGPIAFLCAQYDIDSVMFTKISGTDSSLADMLVNPPTQLYTADTVTTAKFYQQITPEQVKNIVDFFCLDPSLTSLTIHTPVQLFPNHTVQTKTSQLRDRLYPRPAPGRLSDEECSLLDLFRQLNREGRARLVEIADDMVSSGKYIKTDPASLGVSPA